MADRKPQTEKEYGEHADKKEKELRDYHSARNIFGRLKNPPPLGDIYSRLLSDNALQARNKQYELKRQTSSGRAAGYRKGGRVGRRKSARATGRR